MIESPQPDETVRTDLFLTSDQFNKFFRGGWWDCRETIEMQGRDVLWIGYKWKYSLGNIAYCGYYLMRNALKYHGAWK